MTIPELRKKHPEETKNWHDKQCQQYCRSLEILSSIFFDYTVKRLDNRLQRKKVDTYAN